MEALRKEDRISAVLRISGAAAVHISLKKAAKANNIPFLILAVHSVILSATDN